ncbi:uncharacterized protein LOC110465543 [Mizuhopecten yessoensis]|uniref:Uncharacterized protein n=1 Tax=Mizuhopecten yessoensis TaxID=6573 RepID=A0A210R1N1_MIZYE|nr:uncharacterized protein LOC110465543 [Mizuhopecten yessoensis]OWF54980.1 hypothetical protein KP79_PYT17992 [Mizuhopecten yessoensis]
MYSTTSCQDINVIRSCDVGARLQSGGDSSTDILYTDLVESVDASSKRDCDSNMASDDLPAVISYCEACDAASSNEREQDINLKSCRDLRFKANCSKQDRLAGSVGSLGGIVCLENDRMEISNFGKARVVKDRTKTEEDEYNHIEATNEEQEERKNGFMKASSNGKKGTESDQIIDNSGDQEGVDDARTEIGNEEKDSERNIQIKHSSGSLGVQQQERNISDQKQNTSKLRDIKDGYEGHDVLPEDICMTENRSKEFNKQVETEKESEKEVWNLSWKKFNIDKSKKLHIRKTLVIPKTHPVSLTKRQTDGSNNELLIEEDHRKFTQQITTTAVEAKKPSHDKN